MPICCLSPRQFATLLALLAATSAAAQEPTYEPYRGHDVRDAFTLKRDASGKASVAVDGVKLKAILDDLAAHAQNHPPTFRDLAERELAERDVKAIAKVLATALPEAPPGAKDDVPVGLLLLCGQAEALAHNLDVAGASKRANTYYLRLLSKAPDHVQGNFRYGAFLAATATQQKEALPFLERALELGEPRAHRPLAIAHLMLDNRSKALEHLRACAVQFPDDEATKTMIAAVESGAEIARKVDGKPEAKPEAKPEPKTKK